MSAISCNREDILVNSQHIDSSRNSLDLIKGNVEEVLNPYAHQQYISQNRGGMSIGFHGGSQRTLDTDRDKQEALQSTQHNENLDL